MSRSKLPWKRTKHGIKGLFCIEPIYPNLPNVCNNISAEDADFILTAIRERDEYREKYNKLKFILELQNETSQP